MLLTTLAAVLALFPAQPQLLTIPVAEAAHIQPAPYSTTTVAEYARLVDGANHLRGRLYHTLEHESAGWQNIQSLVPSAKGPNGREDSWGICQIHLPAHKEITREQALDWQWCIDWSAEQFGAGGARQWTEYRRLYGGGA